MKAKFAGIAFRLYLTALSLSVLSHLIAVAVGAYNFWEHEKNRSKLEEYMGKFAWPKFENDFHKDTPMAERPGLYKLLTESERCFQSLIQDGGRLWKCEEALKFFEDDMRAEGLTSYQQIGGELDDFFGVWVALCVTAFIIGSRYWITWMATGAWPKKFP